MTPLWLALGAAVFVALLLLAWRSARRDRARRARLTAEQLQREWSDRQW